MFSGLTADDFDVLDIEGNGLDDATAIHCVVVRRSDNVDVYRNPVVDLRARSALVARLERSKAISGHNILGYDLPTLLRLCGITVTAPVLDSLVLSRLLNYKIEGGHSLEAWGNRLGIKKVGADITDWSVWTQEMEDRCISDTEINLALIRRYERIWSSKEWQPAIRTEHFVARICKEMHDVGFCFDEGSASALRQDIAERLSELDEIIISSFPPRAVFDREVHPRRTKEGTFNRNDFRWWGNADLTPFTGGPFCLFHYDEFNPGSPRQIVERLNEAGWKPTEKTDGHIKALKAKSTPKEKLEEYARFGWKVSETNLATLPESAPPAAFKLAERITLASRLSDLEEWLSACKDGAIHGQFQSIGAWTQRLAHQKPNTANIPQSKPSEKDTPFQAEIQKLNGRMRAFFQARPGKRLVGTDADGIQMRIFAHLCNDRSLIEALVNGRKEDETDIHSLNRRLLGPVCGSRDVAKIFIYAFLLGAGVAKVAEILDCSNAEAKTAVDRFITGLPGLADLKRERIPREAAAGFFTGLDGRKVVVENAHLVLAGHLQNGEKVIMSNAMEIWYDTLTRERIPFSVVNWVHDEWQTEIPDDDDICAFVQDVQCRSLLAAGENLGMALPTPGSSEWGYNWKETH